jgi:glycosyltransferase involved in cell wall biosynthesis
MFGIMVEADKFFPENAPAKLKTDPERYLAYCGTMYGDKDGIPDLIRAFAIARKTFSDLKLVLIGDNSDRQRLENVLNLIDLLSLRDVVIFTGRIDFPDMHRLLCGAAALVLSKPDNVQNQGAFPTKLGEYLACGRR